MENLDLIDWEMFVLKRNEMRKKGKNMEEIKDNELDDEPKEEVTTPQVEEEVKSAPVEEEKAPTEEALM